jgi:hypothetical protein
MKIIVFCLTILALILQHFSKRCGINYLNTPKRILLKQDSDSDSGRTLKEAEWEPLRIHLDFSSIENNIGTKFKMQDLIDLKERVMPKTQEIFQKILKVKRIPGKLKLNAKECDGIPIPENLQSIGVDADLIIFVILDDTGRFSKNSIEAAAIHCLQHAETRRPIAGYIEFRPNVKAKDSTSVDYLVWLALHEITHILVFNSGLYEDFIDPKTLQPLGYDKVVGSTMLPSGKKMSFIKTQKMIEKGKKHYNCDKYEGVPLEYNGGPGTAGAHWSKKYMNTDYMIGDSYGENLISDITLALFEDSGWYKPDYDMSNLFLWGRNKGCSFLDKESKCVKTEANRVSTLFQEEFCTNLNYPTCSISHTFRGNCRTRKWGAPLKEHERYFKDPTEGGVDYLTDKCPIAIEVRGDQWYYGGSCRVGHQKIDKIERVCPECACFMSNLRELKERPTLPLKNQSRRLRFKEANPSNSTVVETNLTEQDNEFYLPEEYNSSPMYYNSNHTFNQTVFDEHDHVHSLKKNMMMVRAEPLPKLTTDDLKAHCFDYKCKDNLLYVVINGKSFKCSSEGVTKIEGYEGSVVCPNPQEICHPKFNCKFGCVEKYDNTKPFITFK